MQKKVKEIAYILTGYQALLKARLFFFICTTIQNQWENKDSIMYQTFYLFMSLFSKYNVVLTSKIEDNF